MAPASNERFDHQLFRLLGENDGVLLAEMHEYRAIRQAIIHLMPRLHANDVKTISIEISQEAIDDIRNHKTADAWANSKSMHDIDYGFALDSYAIVLDAQKRGIKVIGHEHTEMEAIYYGKVFEFLKKEYPESERELKVIQENIANAGNRNEFTLAHAPLRRFVQHRYDADPTVQDKLLSFVQPYDRDRNEGMKARNRYAADYINKHKVPGGKVLVLSGLNHTQYGYANYHQDNAIDADKPEVGLEKLLSIPAITYTPTTNLKEMGAVSDAITHANTYIAQMPEDIDHFMKSAGISSWPPLPKGAVTTAADDAEYFKKILEQAMPPVGDLDNTPHIGTPQGKPKPRGK